MLSLTSIWHGDGTFYSCSKYFAQLYCIFAHFEAKNKFVDNGVPWVRRTISAVWVLMRRRRAVDYVEVFNQLKKAAQQHNFQLNPASFMIDFEQATRAAVKTSWPNCLVRGCIFYFIQAIFR
jgi:hypothetical protein